MSNVPERLRNLSQFEYYNTAIALRVEVTKLVMNTHDTVSDFDRLFFELFGERP